jgi:hypothetical protein
LAQGVAHGALTAEQAAAHRSQALESLHQQMEAMEAGRFVPDPHAEERLRLDHLELAMDNLDMFDRVGKATIEAGELTGDELAARREQLIERNIRAIGDLDD